MHGIDACVTQSPVYRIETLDAWGLFRYDDCKNAFLHPDDYSARDFIKQAFGELDPVPVTPSLIAMDPPAHTPLRKLAGQAFAPLVCAWPALLRRRLARPAYGRHRPGNGIETDAQDTSC